MAADELMGLAVEAGPPGFSVDAPVVDTTVPGGAHLVADAGRAILRVPDVGTFAVAGGRSVRFAPASDVHPGVISMWLHGSVTALLLAQQGRFALHASVVQIDGRGVAITGPRGAGKSTTALRLTQDGHRLIADDVSPLDVDGAVTVTPYGRPVHVFERTANALGLDLAGAAPISPAHAKLALPAPAPAGARAPLNAVAVLAIADRPTVESERVRGAQALWQITLNVYRAEILHDLYQAAMFAWARAIIGQVPVHRVTRPATGWTPDAVADALARLA